MIEFYVSGQSLKFFTPVIAADSLNYLTAKVNFADEEWEGYSKWLHFKQDEALGAVTYDLKLNEDNEITAAQKLNLTIGQWEIYLTGTLDDSRLTTVPVILTVRESGLIDAPLHELPLSVAEQVDYTANQALLFARQVLNMAEAGDFDGMDGTSFSPIGHFETVDELAALVTNPSPGDVYSVGTEVPYDIYAWDSINLVWRNHGQLTQGAKGEEGKQGVTFIPTVDASGNISWVNDGGLTNPITRNIMGPKGETGAQGKEGPGAYEKAKEAGYTGTESTFYAALTYMPYHNKRHLPGGADPIIVQTDGISDGAVTRTKLANNALYSPLLILSETEHVLDVSDVGKTIRGAYNEAFNITVTKEASAAMPSGAEFAILRYSSVAGGDVTISFTGEVNVCSPGWTTYEKAPTLKISDSYTMIALKKLTSADMWLVTGNVEVV